MTKRRNFVYLGVLLAAALFAFGCGGDDGGLSSEDMARIDAAEMTAEQAKTALAALQAQIDTDTTDPAPDTDADTSDLAAQIAELEALLAKLTAVPATIPETLGGKKSTLSAADLAVASKKLAGELKGLHDHDADESLVNLMELTPDTAAADLVDDDARTRNVTHASQLKEGTKEYFLRHTFKGTGTKVDLSSPGDLDSLTLGKLLTVDGVDLMSVSFKETDKVTVVSGTYTDTDGGVFTPGALLMLLAPTRRRRLGAPMALCPWLSWRMLVPALR